VKQFEARIELASPGGREGLLEIRLDSLNGSMVGWRRLIAGNDNSDYKVLSCVINGDSGLHDVFLVFTNLENGFCKIDWFRFNNDLTQQDSTQYGPRLFPNPASSGFYCSFICSSTSEINIEIFTLEGILIKSVRQNAQYSGENLLFFNTMGIAQGIYIVKCRINNYSKSLKLCVVQ